MKNIHILPTDKPSRLGRFIDTNNLFLRTTDDIPRGENINIYITSEEEIKDCWFLNTLSNEIGFTKGSIGIPKNAKKIILTTDQDLIKDGVQPIDNDFLEWFVKNPSCESVETYSLGIENGETGESYHYKYEIIITKEQQKKHIIDIMKSDEELGLYEQTKCYCGHTTTCDCGPEQEITLVDIFNEEKRQGVKELIDKHKQETLEEAAENFWLNDDSMTDNDRISYINGFLACAKWQQERSYSEEEVIQLVSDWTDYRMSEDIKSKVTFKKWFEQFKKK
jgi:hypothetical protein